MKLYSSPEHGPPAAQCASSNSPRIFSLPNNISAQLALNTCQATMLESKHWLEFQSAREPESSMNSRQKFSPTAYLNKRLNHFISSTTSGTITEAKHATVSLLHSSYPERKIVILTTGL